ncbi:hypothetical protein IMZ11_02805 [Microtetraspora sp. AC03309]|uniref:hypothetical protein n=1 Tax=Microtetraspora sp. AC03309 TaxID=2779376 RepID=UPI001E4BBEC4|nr:hypothetical protein [Microtetraspora sp. AC03309]MCC5574570.1 hypothetical protein [Microtetraspora sp. AC03309]
MSRLADALDELTQPRVSPPDMYQAMCGVVPTFQERREATAALASSLRHVAGYERWLYRWTGPRPRTEVVALVRNAAAELDPPRFCKVGHCTRMATTSISADGFFHICDSCAADIDVLAGGA